jgi:hypothetical protein
MIYELPSKSEVTAYLAANKPIGALLDRVNGWLDNRGYVRGEMRTAIRGDGVIIVDTDRDPSQEWDEFDPMTPIAQLDAARQRRQFLNNQLLLLDAGTATPLNVQRILAWLGRRELGIEQ